MADLAGLGSIFDFGTEVIKRLWPDASEAEKAKLGLMLAELDAQVKVQQAQLAVNQAEAGSSSVFVAGWRPALGWSIAAILAYSYILYPLLGFGLAVADAPIVLPKLALDENLWQLILGMLGLAAGRTVEKIKGVSR